MTATASQRIAISAQDIQEAQSVPLEHGTSLCLVTASGEQHKLPSELEEILLRTIATIAQHGSVSIGQIPDELTSTAAADLLGVSRPTLLKWARDGRIDSFTAGTHTRFHRADVIRLRTEREMERRKAFEELRALDAEGDFEHFND